MSFRRDREAPPRPRVKPRGRVDSRRGRDRRRGSCLGALEVRARSLGARIRTRHLPQAGGPSTPRGGSGIVPRCRCQSQPGPETTANRYNLCGTLQAGPRRQGVGRERPVGHCEQREDRAREPGEEDRPGLSLGCFPRLSHRRQRPTSSRWRVFLRHLAPGGPAASTPRRMLGEALRDVLWGQHDGVVAHFQPRVVIFAGDVLECPTGGLGQHKTQ